MKKPDGIFKFIRKRGYTDRLYFVNLVFAWTFTLACFVLTIFSGYLGITDMSIVSVGLGCVYGELSVHTGFIIWKAKTENINKKDKGVEYFNADNI